MRPLPSWKRLKQLDRRWWVLPLVIALAGSGAWLKFGPDAAASPTSINSTVSRGTFKTTVSATGTITPKKDVDLSFTSSGTVTKVAVKAGAVVEQGDLLATIDSTALQAQRAAAAAQLTAANAALSGDSGSSSAQVASDQAAVAAAESSLASAKDALANATLRAPFTGMVSAVGYAVGDTAGSSGNQPAADGSASTAVITLISPHKLLVEANVSATDVSTLKKGMQAEITPTGGGAVLYGTVSEIGRIASASDTGSAQFPVTIAVTGTPTGLYPGSSATVAITTKQATDVLTVPTQALHTENGGTYVYKMVGTRRTKATVTVGTAYGMQTEVLTGLKEGDTVQVVSFSQSGGGNAPAGGLFNNKGTGGTGPSFGGPAGGGTGPQIVTGK